MSAVTEGAGAIIAHYYMSNVDEPVGRCVSPPSSPYKVYLLKYDSLNKPGTTMPPRLSANEYALAERVLKRLSEAGRDPDRIRELRARLLRSTELITGE